MAENATIVEGVEEVEGALRGLSRRATREAIDVWFSASQDWLNEAAAGRTGRDNTRDSRGALQGRQSNGLHRIAQSAQPPRWNSAQGAWEFVYTHSAAVFHEYGAEPHEIKARRAEFLAFEWPDAPPEVQEMFEETFPLVFFKSVQHPGVPAIGYVRNGRQRALQYLREKHGLPGGGE